MLNFKETDTKKELIKTIREEPTTIDEGGVEFSTYGIRVWFEGYGTGPVQQVYTDKKDVDFLRKRMETIKKSESTPLKNQNRIKTN